LSGNALQMEGMERWSIEQSRAWQQRTPYLLGANFLPSNAINQLEMWQAATFDPDTIRRELGFAANLGMTAMRVYLHDLLWEQDAAGFCERIDAYLGIADGLGIKTILVIFDDCHLPTAKLGTQPEPKPMAHNPGWVQSPGPAVANDPDRWPRLETYVKGVLARFKDDPRIALWDLYNEPGNGRLDQDGGKQGERTLPLLKATFGWAREVEGLSQPLTTGLWDFKPLNAWMNNYALEVSDIITFHCYSPPAELVPIIHRMLRYDRPVVCTEYMGRWLGSTFEHCLPVLKQYDIGAINWGLVAGKSQTTYPWAWNPGKGEPDILFHDVFHPDGTLLYPDEERVIRRVSGKKAESGT